MPSRSKRQNIVLQMNALKPGLNLIVPSDWWAELLRRNIHTHHIDQLVLPDSGPLDALADLQIVKMSFEVCQGEYSALIEASVRASQRISHDLKSAQQPHSDSQSKKRSKAVCSWWKNESGELSFAQKILYSPYVCKRTLGAIGLEDFSWVVVSPHLYRRLTEHDFSLKGEPYDRIMVGIAVVLQAGRQPTLAYDLGETEFRRVELYNFNRRSYAFIGQIEAKETQQHLLAALYQGMEILCQEGEAQFPEDSRSRLICMKDTVYYDFQQDEELPPLSLKWLPFAAVAHKPIREMDLLTITEFSSSPACSQQSDQNRQYGRKKVKPNEEIDRKESQHVELDGRKGRVAVVKGSDNGTDGPSSTQQTAEEFMHQIGKETQRAQDPIERIYFSLWKGDSLQYYRTLCEQQMNCYLPVLKPFLKPADNQQTLILKQNNKNYYIDLHTNPLHHDSNGLLEEQEHPQQQHITQSPPIPQDIIKYLEGLAISLAKQKVETGLSEIKEEGREADGKEKSEFQSLTCKEYDIEEESRQF